MSDMNDDEQVHEWPEEKIHGFIEKYGLGPGAPDTPPLAGLKAMGLVLRTWGSLMGPGPDPMDDVRPPREPDPPRRTRSSPPYPPLPPRR